MTINPHTNKPHGRLDAGARFIPCTAEAHLCIDPFCDHTTVVVLDVVAEPDVAGISAWTGAPSETVQAEVTDAIARAEVAEARQWARDERRHNERVSRQLAAERAHTELQNRACNLDRELRMAEQERVEVEWQLRNQTAWVNELAGLVHDAQRAADKALARWDRIR